MGTAITALRAKHHVTSSGSMRIKYPREWEGRVHISAGGSGSVDARGQGLELQRMGKKEIFGQRGKGVLNEVEVREDGSGSVGFDC